MNHAVSRRDLLRGIAAVGLAASIGGPAMAARRLRPPGAGPDLTLPPLPYADDALEPHIDAETMQIHHDRHHKAYVDNANKALADTALAGVPPEEILARLGEAPEAKRSAIRNNVGGHVNHSLFWTLMAPDDQGGGGEPAGPLADAINSAFGSFAGAGGFRDQFGAAASGRFGSGWAWLVSSGNTLSIHSTANQDSPLMGEKIAGCAGTPLLGLDVWEHAYYLKYRNRRADYINAWWNVVNWPRVAERYAAAKH